MNIVAPIFTYAKKYPEKAAIVNESSSMSYRTLAGRISRVMIGLNKYERKHLRVGILTHSQSDAIEILCGTVAAGHIMVLLDPKWSNEQLIKRIKEVDILFTEKSFNLLVNNKTKADVVIYATEKNDSPINNIHLTGDPTDLSPSLGPGGTSPFYIGFTSGTTNDPKAFIRHHQSWMNSFKACRPIFKIHEESHVVAPGSIMHSLFLFAVFHTLFEGATLYVLNNFSSTRLIERIEQHPISHVYLVPTMVESLISSLTHHELFTFSPSLITSGDKLSSQTKQRLQAVWPNVNLYEFYGASELSFVSVATPKDHSAKASSVGRPFENVQLSIRDETGSPVSTGQAGTLYVKSDMLFTGYVNDEKQTANIWRDGWAVTGDIAKIDDDGYLYLVGREKNRIITGGWNVFPEKIEAVLKKHTNFNQLAVIGLPSKYWGEIPILVIEGATLKGRSKELRDIYRECLPKYEWPRRVYTIDEFPYTSSGKIARARLKDMIMR